MAKKKTGAKKVARKTTKMFASEPLVKLPEKPKAPAEPKPAESKVAPPVAPPKPKVAPAAAASKAKVAQGAIVERRWPGIEKGYPDPFDVENEGKTATHRIFTLKKEVFLQGKYPAKKIIIPLG